MGKPPLIMNRVWVIKNELVKTFFQLRGNPHDNYANERQTTFSENNLKLNNQT
ncbi:hypothetical protein HanXRQr2_Chr14g0645321 [Helianthus annuus]|uniref:Uncharacterized protein n=1 Tax=Helianthus annuus TaxID=4232 RepID=A0A9K3E9T9_HELAN|nr:hypothetical protein HanXRQr2_Chr14g0645321 [Helianthus annuus]